MKIQCVCGVDITNVTLEDLKPHVRCVFDWQIVEGEMMAEGLANAIAKLREAEGTAGVVRKLAPVRAA
jgi:hypothetical protein